MRLNDATEDACRAAVLFVDALRSRALDLGAKMERAGFEVDYAICVTEAAQRMRRDRFDAILVCHETSRTNGFQLCEAVRTGMRSATPILAIGSGKDVPDLVNILKAGADDFMTHPADSEELQVRLQCLVRRSKGHFTDILRVGDLALDPRSRRATRAGVELALAPIPFQILSILLREYPRVVSRAELTAEIWGSSIPVSDALRTHMHQMRKVVDHAFGARSVRMVSRAGYCIWVED